MRQDGFDLLLCTWIWINWLGKLQRQENKPTILSTYTLEQHLPCSFCMIVVERDNPETLHFLYTLDTTVWNAGKKKVERPDFYQQKRKFQCFLATALPRDTWSRCWIRNFDFNYDKKNILDHCHFNGHFIGYARREKILKRRTLNYTPVTSHSMMS